MSSFEEAQAFIQGREIDTAQGTTSPSGQSLTPAKLHWRS